MEKNIFTCFIYAFILPTLLDFFLTKSSGKKFNFGSAYAVKAGIVFLMALAALTLLDYII